MAALFVWGHSSRKNGMIQAATMVAPPGFRRVNGVCQPIDGVSANPADDIADDIEKATMPIIRPLDSSTGDDVTTDPVNDDPAGIVFRRPNYFAGGGAVSEGMGSAIDSFISAMGGKRKKKI